MKITSLAGSVPRNWAAREKGLTLLDRAASAQIQPLNLFSLVGCQTPAEFAG